ncbi:sigma-54-dependent transcriptional regulator [Oryzomonas rubra]|uniref:Sigma-54-dependent Fis family transcriptional regulator n=1 Tax=Oryzomonas rubra TaxID=2509454 RepID=A0A5A9XQV6_9BACT|nr:sigma-54 dependent transcriptional regulator [Oryzomonas rubra]KAA0895426.1 sigma-54-dependent Fis family transcriptional regulator [Oryzomonas rubra]
MTDTQKAQKNGKVPLVLFVDDNADFLEEIRFVLLSNSICEMVTLTDSSQVLAELDKGIYSALFLDWIMPGVSGADLLPVIAQKYPTIPVIIMTGVSDVDTVVSCMKQGAMDYITKPLDSSRLISSINNAFKILELSNQNQQLQNYLLGDPLAQPDTFKDILTRSDKMQSIFKLVETIAPSRYPVLITGETGVGKELIARAIHKASGQQGSFTPLNVAGLDAHMFEDTLFGHKKGAFTGANELRQGLIAKAQGGTLFLDEIGDLAPESQIKLLRLLQENEYYRLGSDVLLKSDARIIVASNRDFKKLVAEGTFREDLYHRICYHKLHIPPLRERREDIMPLVNHYINMAAKAMGKRAPRIAAELRWLLEEYEYPGNVRELINKVGSAVVVNKTGLLVQSDFPDLAVRSRTMIDAGTKVANSQFSLHVVFPTFPSMGQIEKLMFEEALKVTGGKKGPAADLLGVCRQTVQKKLSELEKMN